MAEIVYNEEKGEWEYRQMLRSPYIDYCNGRFFVTFQCYHNKSVFGAIVGNKCVLNELGEAVEAAWRSEPQHVKGLKLGEFVVMPNHFHAIVEYHATERSGSVATSNNGAVATGIDLAQAPCSDRATAPCSDRAQAPCGDRATVPGRIPAQAPCSDRATAPGRYTRASDARDLPYVIGLFKSYTTNLYYRLKSAGKCIDIGQHLWQASFYDELIRDDTQYHATALYIRHNPDNWNSDRFGAVTSYAEGNLGLLQGDYVAYLSSEGKLAESGLPMRRYSHPQRPVATGPLRPVASHPPVASRPPVISTFTSYYERQVLSRCLSSNRRFIWVLPGGITPEALASTAAARAADLALLISPVAPETGVNKQRATWCNQFIAKNADEIWVGHIRPGGSLEAILKTITTKVDQ